MMGCLMKENTVLSIKILVRKAQISVESYLVYQSVSQKSILCDVYFITLNDIDLIIYAN